jgi:hypothetical protein
MPATRLFLDTEFTGLHQGTTLISLALSAEDGREFYAEFSDYDEGQCDDWIATHVIARTRWLSGREPPPRTLDKGMQRLCFGDTSEVRRELTAWLAEFEQIEVWADCLAYDWVLFCELFGGALHLPSNIFYMPFDLATLFRAKGLDPDADRAVVSGMASDPSNCHNALWDARTIKRCYAKLMADT